MSYSIGNISTSQFYDRANSAMAGLSTKADALQTQVATGKRLVAPSSDSVAYQRLRGLARDAADDVAYTANLQLASESLRQADTALGNVGDQLQRAGVLAIQARNGTQTASSRAAIAAEIDAIIDGLATLANTKDARGQYIFGSADGGAAAVKQPDGSYALSTTAIGAIPTGPGGQTVQTGEAAARVFQVGSTDAFQVLQTLSAELKAGGTDSAALGGAIDEITAASAQASTIQASLGARAARVELEQTRLVDIGIDREEARSALEDTDISAALIELQKTMTILSATQASFSKLQGLSLFSYLR
jgi:flagellar hook-associated protein 3 FlgL